MFGPRSGVETVILASETEPKRLDSGPKLRSRLVSTESADSDSQKFFHCRQLVVTICARDFPSTESGTDFRREVPFVFFLSEISDFPPDTVLDRWKEVLCQSLPLERRRPPTDVSNNVRGIASIDKHRQQSTQTCYCGVDRQTARCPLLVYVSRC